ncbi:MAG: hypothetical protein ACWGHO_03805 [Candidatus Moraniibacteriota bacterium]
MKLKILLMPVAIIISMVLIIWHIYPTWLDEETSTSITNIKKEIAKTEGEISDIETRKSNIEKLSQSLASNADSEALINKFYPTYRNDEDVVNSINNIAFAEGVFLLDMKVEYKKIETSDDPTKLLLIPLEKVEPVIDDPQLALNGEVPAVEVDENGVPIDSGRTKIKFIETSLKIYGNYDQIKKFLISLNKAGLINNIQSFKVYKKENKEVVGGEERAVEGDILNVDMVVGFTYLLSSTDSPEKLLRKSLFEKSEFDFSRVADKQDVLTGNYKKSEVGETGSANPFAKEGAGAAVSE